METPNDPIFKFFYYLGFIYIIGAFLAGSYITYDWFKSRGKKDDDN